MRRGRCGGVVGDGGGKDAKTSFYMIIIMTIRKRPCEVPVAKKLLTRGGLRYSIPMLLALRVVFKTSFAKL